MGDQDMNLLWYAFCIAKGIVLLSFWGALGLIFKCVLRLIRSKSAIGVRPNRQ
jgi:hypothetical protein